MRSLLSLVMVLLIVFVSYKLYFSQMQSATGGTAPARAIDIVGVKNDLIAIAQAERAYLAEHGSYASLDQLSSSGTMTMAKSGRDGYTYQIETSDSTFRVIAQCPVATSPGCANYAVDSTMEVRSTP